MAESAWVRAYPPLIIDNGSNGTSPVHIDDVVVINAYDIVKLTTDSQGLGMSNHIFMRSRCFHCFKYR